MREASGTRASDVRYTKSQSRIDRINELVRKSKLERDQDAITEVIYMFEPLIRKVANHYFKQYGDLIPLDALLQETREQFIDLMLNAHVLGGPANFTTFMNIFLFRRVQKFVIKERRFHYDHDRIEYAEVHREIDLTVEDEDLVEKGETTSAMQTLVADILEEAYSSDMFDETEVRIFEEAILKNRSDTQIAQTIGLSRPYVSRIHKRVLLKIQERFGDRWRKLT